MASLTSPGVSITVIDESTYASTAVGTVAYILIASDQDKLNASGTVASYTTKANAGKVFAISSQRELVQYFGMPQFRMDSNGGALHADELNEYGLLAAYSALGVGNRMLIQRADIDLAQLKGTSIRPIGTPSDGVFWLDTADTNFGIYEWIASSGSFMIQTPTIINSSTQISGSAPKNSIGSIGDFAVVTYSAKNPVYYKRYDNTWVAVGSDAWLQANPTVVGSITNPGNIQIGQNLIINGANVLMTGTTLSSAQTDIQQAGIQGVTATTTNGQLEIRIDSTAASTGNVQRPDGMLTITAGVHDAAVNLGLLPANITTKTWLPPAVHYGAFTSAPAWKSSDLYPRPDGSIWLKTSAKGNGASWGFKKYSTAVKSWLPITAPIYADHSAAILDLDYSGGGANIPVGTVFLKYDVDFNSTQATPSDAYPLLTFKAFVKDITTSAFTITGSIPSSPFIFTSGDSFLMTVSSPGTVDISRPIVLDGTDTEAFVSAIQSAKILNISAYETNTGAIAITHQAGGTIRFDYISGSPSPLETAGFTSAIQAQCADHVQILNSVSGIFLASPFVPLTYIASSTAPYANPASGTLWYYSNPTDVDIMVHDGSGWKGYQNVTNDSRGYNLSLTDPAGVILAATTPLVQTDGTALVPGDLWIDTSDLENFPKLYRYNQSYAGVNTWDLIDLTDNTGSDGIIFGDARWDSSGTVDPVTGNLPSIPVLLQSDYLDADAPDYRLHARGSLLFNTRRSGYNVKRFELDYAPFVNATYPPTMKKTWVSHSGEDVTGVPYFGHKAQRNTIVTAMKSAINSSVDIREDQFQFNLLCCPGYPELMLDMVALNNDRKQTGFIIGDSPMTLDSSTTSILSWSTNAKKAVEDGKDGLTSHSPYLAVYYPSGMATNLDGSLVAVPPSHMALRTMIFSDNVSYPWFAPAGARRGVVDNASAIGYVDTTSNNAFRSIGVTQSLRDVLYENNVNPLTVMPGAGILVYGQKTRQSYSSSLDRINVARLICYLRIVLDTVARPFIFEPNDTITRNQVKTAFEQVFNDLVAKRGVTDYLVVCDQTNNTSDRIARNELWVDVAIEPTRAIEFVYIPIRLKNPGDIAKGV